VLVGIGLLLMGGLTGTSSWTHLIPGFIVSGVGAGLVNPPLASASIGVVQPERAGMASGINATFRQIGIAVSIAALGSIFTASLQRNLARQLAPLQAFSGHTQQVVTAIRQGQVGGTLNAAPPAVRAQLAAAIRSSFASGINDLLVVTAILALVGGLAAALLIRPKDFVVRAGPEQAAPTALDH